MIGGSRIDDNHYRSATTAPGYNFLPNEQRGVTTYLGDTLRYCCQSKQTTCLPIPSYYDGEWTVRWNAEWDRSYDTWRMTYDRPKPVEIDGGHYEIVRAHWPTYEQLRRPLKLWWRASNLLSASETDARRQSVDNATWQFCWFFVNNRNRLWRDEHHRTADVDTRRRLRFADTAMLVAPSTRRSTLGDRAFPAASARAWNSLPSSVRNAPSLTTFRRELKTVLFGRRLTMIRRSWLYCTV